MKFKVKSTIFILIITLAALSCLGVAVFANDNAELPEVEAPVGSYTAPQGAWAPDPADNIAYAVWQSEQDYLAGNAPVNKYTDTLVVAKNITAAGIGYVHFFKDVTCSERVEPPKASVTKYNLGGHEFNTTFDLQLTSDFYNTLYVVNGRYTTTHQIKCSTNNKLIFENVYLTVKNGTFGYGLGADLLLFKDCKVDLQTDGVHMYLASGSPKVERQVLRFENTDIFTSGNGKISSTYGFFRFIDHAGLTTKWDITFDKNSSLNANVPKLVTIEDRVGKDMFFASVQNITFEEGFSFSENAVPSFTYSHIAINANNTAQLPAVTKPADNLLCNISLVNPETNVAATGKLYATLATDGMYLISSIKATEGIGWYCTPAGSNITTCVAEKHVEGREMAILSLADFRAFAEGSTVELAQDLFFYTGDKDTLVSINGYKNDLKIDLGGHTLYVNDRFTISGPTYNPYPTHWLTFRNGTIRSEAPKDCLFYGWPCEDGGLVLEDLDIHFNGTKALIGSYNGNFIFKNCNIQTLGTVLELNQPYKYNVEVDNSNINAKIFATYYLSPSTNSTSISIKNSTFDIQNYVFTFYSAKDAMPAATDILNINISNSYLKSLRYAFFDTQGTVNTTFDNTWTSFPIENASANGITHKLSAAKGQIICAVEDETYKYRVTNVDVELRASLNLKSDLTVNFYVPVDTNALALTISGVTYVLSEQPTVEIKNLGKHYQVSLATITPDVAAEEIVYTLTFEHEGKVHSASFKYSIIDYVKAVLDTDYTTVAKQLVTAVTEYINAAYISTGNSNDKLAELMASPLYRSYLGELVVPDAAVGDMSAVSAAIMGAQLNLIGGVYVRFNLSPAYTGTVTVGDNSYVVVNGMVGELGYIELNLPADVLFNTVFTVSATDIDGTGIYSLSDYALAVANSNDCSAADKNLVASFYSYAAYAAAYSAIYN